MATNIYKDGWSNGWIEGGSILFAVCVVLIVTAANNWVKDKKFQKHQSKGDAMTAKIIRNSTLLKTDAQELVVGDVIELTRGDIIPADCIIFTAEDLSVNEANLTGEPEPIRKEVCNSDSYANNPNPFLLQGTLVETGTAKAIVVAVGSNTLVGRAGLTMNIERDMTSLQLKLERIAEKVSTPSLCCAIITFIAMIAHVLIKIFHAKTRPIDDYQNLIDVFDAFMIGVTVVIVTVPEGLPLIISISNAFSVGAMAEQANYQRELHASETMGNI